MPFLFFILFYFYFIYKSFQRPKPQDPGPRCISGTSQISCLPTQLADTLICFDKCNHFDNRAIHNHFVYSKALPRKSLCLTASRVSVGQANRLLASGSSHHPPEEPRASETQKHPQRSGWVLGRHAQGKTKKRRLPRMSNFWSNPAPMSSVDLCIHGTT